MPNPLNYTTQVDAGKTAGECVALLAAHKATHIGLEYDDGQPTGVHFKIATPHGPRQYTLPVNPDGTYRALSRAKVAPGRCRQGRSEEHTSELQSHSDLVCRLLLEKKKPALDIERDVLARDSTQYTSWDS